MALPVTTLVPFAQLPQCASLCGPLFDANGACVPPAAAAADERVYANCFCSHSKLQPFVTATAGVCDAACPTDPSGLGSIQGWFTSFCAKQISTATGTSTGSSSTSGASKGGSSSSGGGGDWLSTHWKWVIMIVIVVVAIAGIWIGACIWRRRYLKRKDRMYELGKGAHPSSLNVAGTNPYGTGVAGRPTSGAPGMAAGVLHEKPKKSKERKKWAVTERT